MSLAQQLENYEPNDKEKTWLRDMVMQQPNRAGKANILRRAIMAQHPWKVQQVLSLGGRLDLQTDLAMFSVAMEHGYDEVVERALDDGLDANICGLYQTAVYYNNINIFKKIEATGADTAYEKDECLAIAARKGHTDITRYLLDKYDYNAYALKMALSDAAANNHHHDAALLYQAGVDVTDGKNDARVIDPMVMAVNNNCDDMILWLEAKRARAETYDLEETYFNNQSILGLRMKSNGQYDENGFVLAAKSGCFSKMLDRLVDKTQDISSKDLQSQDRHGNNVIEILAERGQLNAILRPSMWRGRLPVLKQLLDEYLTPRYQDQMKQADDFLHQQAMQGQLQKHKGITLKRRH